MNSLTDVPRVILTEGAVNGLERCRVFLAKKNPVPRCEHKIDAVYILAFRHQKEAA